MLAVWQRTVRNDSLSHQFKFGLLIFVNKYCEIGFLLKCCRSIAIFFLLIFLENYLSVIASGFNQQRCFNSFICSI